MRSFLATRGGRIFGIVWLGQLASNLGSSMTRFGLAIWVYRETGSATQLALIVLASQVPMLLASPFAGALVDRWDRRRAMIVADTGAAAATFAVMMLLLSGRLEVWHLYLALSFGGAFQAFQFPAYSAATTMLVPKEQYARASGLVQLAGSLGRIAAPVVAAAVVVASGLTLLFVVDFVSYLLAVGTLFLVRFPEPDRSAENPRGSGLRALLAEARAGLDFVVARPALLILLLSFLVVNFAFAFQGVLLIPMLLNIASEQIAGAVVSIGALGIVAGSLLLSLWGGPRNRIAGVYAPIAAMGVGLVIMGITSEVVLVIAGILLINVTHPVAGGSSQAIWQSKVPPSLQGRVFAVRQVTAIAASPIAFVLAGTLADRVFEPLLAEDGSLLAAMLGSGPGRGIGLLFILTGFLAVGISLAAWRHPRIRALDAEVPDFDIGALEPEAAPA
jgi:MFS family permease